ncbi:MAG: hypothetical protein GY862_32260 [Gammaproteobacteria bacterium]|nr:hypothetical protein [Gammaproteobacteria bacterium]
MARLVEESAKNTEYLAERVAERKLTEHERVLASARRSLDAAKQAEEDYADKVLALRRQLADQQLSDDDKLRSLRQATMSAGNREADKELQINEKLQASRDAMAGGDEKAAKSLAESAKSLAAGLKNKAKAIELFEKASAASQQVTETQIGTAEKTQAELQTIIKAEAPVIKIEADVLAADAAIESLKNKLAELDNSTVTVEIQHISKHQGGGMAGFPRLSGQLPGFGTVDEVPALLTRGEFITPADRVAEFSDILHFMTYAPLDSVRDYFEQKAALFHDGGPVLKALPSYRDGGPVSAGAAAGPEPVETIRLDFNIGRHKGAMPASPAAEVRKLVDAFREQGRGL